MTLEILKETKVGVTVNKCKKKHTTNNTVNDICKSLIGDWKKVAEQPSNISVSTAITSSSSSVSLKSPELSLSDTLSSYTSSSTEPTTSPRLSDGASSPRSKMDEIEYDNLYANLHKSRKQVVDIFAQNLLSATSNNASIARFLSMSIESSLHAAFPWDDNYSGDSKPYMAKFRSLSYNLKRNEVCNIYLLFMSYAIVDKLFTILVSCI